MPVNYRAWVESTGVKRPKEEVRMDYIKYVAEYKPQLAPVVKYDWLNIYARDEQVPYYFSNDWDLFAAIAGRGFGKTRLGLGWVDYLINIKHPNDKIFIGVVCPVFNDIRDIMIEGPAGIKNLMSQELWDKLDYNISEGTITYPNGSRLSFYSADNPERFRGKQWSYAWLDELAAYEPAKIPLILKQVNYCLRIQPPLYKDIYSGEMVVAHCQKLITTTPKPQPWIRAMFRDALKDPHIVIATGSTYDNKANLDEKMFKNIIKDEGTADGDQEIHGKVLLENDDGIIKREWIRLWDTKKELPKLYYVFGSYDPAASEKQENDPSAMVMFGVFLDEDSKHSLIVLDTWSEWLRYSDLREQILHDWERRYGDTPMNRKKPGLMIVENKSTGQAILQDIDRMGVKMIKYTPSRGDDKWSRLNSVSHLIRSGRLYMAESVKNPGTVHAKYRMLYDQLCDFPLVDHDDLVDCISQGLIIFSQQGVLEGEMTEREYDLEYDGFESQRTSYSSEKTKNPYIC